MSEIRIIAHRGASGYAPENTVSSFRKALEFGIREIELDIHQTADNKIVVIHDPVLDKTTDGRGKIAQMNYSELAHLDAGSWFSPDFEAEKIPLLEQIFDLVDGKARLIIEVKFGSHVYPGIEENLIQLIKKHRLENDVIISSSKVTVLNRLMTINKSIALARIVTPKELWRQIFSANSYMYKHGLIEHLAEIHSHWSLVDFKFMNWLRSKGLKIVTWTVNKERRMKSLMDWGVDGIITNFPDRAMELVKSRSNKKSS